MQRYCIISQGASRCFYSAEENLSARASPCYNKEEAARRAVLADGAEAIFNIYKGVVLWDGQPVTIRIDEIEADSLVGMSLMYGYELVLPVLDGSTFTLRRIPNP